MWILIAAILVICWLVAFVVLHVTSFFIHLLLLIAIAALILHFVRGRKGAP